ncbi:putative RDD family membrane protein YckC [Pedobacter sp. UYP30]|uniref:RDD family protein n=1 Tax=Pedobacter sp. UYP30 TaxID=1756400 RepID=UPI003396D01A
METIKISTAQNIDIEYEVAGLGERVLARLIDLAGFLVLYIISIILFGVAAFTHSSVGFYVIMIGFLVVFIFYDLVCELTMNGQSVGKKIMKIRVISLTGSQPTLSQYLLRWLFRIIDFSIVFGFGVVAVLAVAFTEKHQRIGDMIAKTIVIKTKPRTAIGNIAFSAILPEDYQPVFPEAIHLNDAQAALVQEVLMGFYKTGHADLIYSMAEKTKVHIAATMPQGMNELQFLETVLKDYNHLTSAVDK